MRITPRTEYVGASKTGSLNPNLTAAAISRALVGIRPDRVRSGDGKVTISWEFYADGMPCGIWDYNGIKWSTFGPPQVFTQLFNGQYTEGPF